MSDSSTTNSEWPPLNDVIQAHLEGCSECQKAAAQPNGLGQKTTYCSNYWRIFQLYAEREGELNNVVAHDEYGNQAPRAANPERPYRPI